MSSGDTPCLPHSTDSAGWRRPVKRVPDIILLDIQLPGMDGYAVARALRQVPTLRDTPIVAVTSYAMVGDRERVDGGRLHGIHGKADRSRNIRLGRDAVGGFAAADGAGTDADTSSSSTTSEENLYYLRALLRRDGFAVTKARHGAEALVVARRGPPSSWCRTC